ncbi:MAG: SUMF1/EgtB/PvdO family nonheme iron enzyme [Polyangiaceae bacterium]|nr:SUMF1/EgtB/PvdO family nonheme iron enzyme [Polyangiaceae bacterium]
MVEDVFGLVGRTVEGKYLVQGLIGEGGFSVVYRALHRHLDQPVAVKVLKVPAHFAAAGRRAFIEFFHNEGRILSNLADHPAIVRVFDFGTIEGSAQSLFYLVLEWLEGCDLESILTQDRPAFSEADTIRFLRPAIEALALAHSEGIAHRDLKPANLFLARTKLGLRLKVLDFGIAKAIQEGERTTQLTGGTASGFHVFTPQYGAPEQFRPGMYGATGTWTDIHALGLILVELVTGRPALEGTDLADFLLGSTCDRRPTPRTRGTLVSDGFEALCQRSLALEPRDRYRNAGELLAALDALHVDDAPGAIPHAPDRVARTPAEPTVPLQQWLATQVVSSGNAFDANPDGLGPPFCPHGDEASRAKGTPPGLAAPTGPDRVPRAGHTTARRSPLWLGGLGAILLAGGAAIALRFVPWAYEPSVPPSQGTTAAVSAMVAPIPARSSAASTSTAPDSTSSANPSGSGARARPPLELPDTVPIPAGEFAMGSNGGDADERPVHRVALKGFDLDTTEVTVGAYEDCYRQGPCSAPGTGNECNWGRPSRERHPMNCVDARQADAFCRWKGKRLPSEEELEYAAAGAKGRTYPWGEQPPTDELLCWGRRDGTCEVGTRPSGISPFGVYDLAGNVAEWTVSPYCDSYAPTRICVTGRVFRGSSFSELRPENVRNAYRDENDPTTRSPYLGFRCARSP